MPLSYNDFFSNDAIQPMCEVMVNESMHGGLMASGSDETGEILVIGRTIKSAERATFIASNTDNAPNGVGIHISHLEE